MVFEFNTFHSQPETVPLNSTGVIRELVYDHIQWLFMLILYFMYTFMYFYVYIVLTQVSFETIRGQNNRKNKKLF